MNPHEGPHVGRPHREPALHDSLIGYIRATGTVSTSAVAEHFGWTMKRAQRELAALRDEGLVVSHSAEPRYGRHGAMNLWTDGEK